MARVVPVHTNFTGGEISPRLLGREDIERYRSGCATLSNFEILPHGGARRRAGFHYVASVKDSDEVSRLLPFEHSVLVAYVLEFADLFMRVFRDNGQIVTAPDTPYEIATPYLEADLFDIQYAQASDVMYLTSANYWPRKLSRTGDTAWTLSNYVPIDGPYLDANDTATTLNPSGTTGNITIAASTSFFNVGHAPVGTEPGAYFQLHGGYVQVTAYNSATSVDATVLDTLSASTATTTWREGAWSSYRGFPRAVSFFEERLYFGGTDYQPQTLWGSAVSAYNDHTPGTADDDAVNYTMGVARKNQNTIQWLQGHKLLFIGTSGGTFTAGDANAPLTPSNVRILPQASHGSAYIQPVTISNILLFVSRSRRKLRELSFDFRDESYRAPDMTLLAEHITRSGIVQLDYAEEPDAILYAVRADGTLASCTYDREQEIVAWNTLPTNGTIESVAVIPATSGTEGYDQVWVIAKRTVNGATVRYVEYLEQYFDNGDSAVDVTDAFFVDAGLQYDGVATTTLSGLDHLEGETVQVLGDGAEMPDAVVASGSITLASSVTKASVGLGYTSTLQLLPAITGARDGTTQGRAKSWGRVKARLFESLGMQINGIDLAIRSTADLMDTAIDPYTGWREVQVNGWDEEGQITFAQTRPLPLTLLSVAGTLQVEDL